ncbi:MAG: alanine racemase [Parasphingorhabdus sp.]|uniref:alanine racemase n=1 Tax=Parasphingorhabdus sp. TaxID=2709688 RepID=UPI003297BD97
MSDKKIENPSPLRLRLDSEALVSNWQALDQLSGAATAGAAIKANGYGLGAEPVSRLLQAAGCKDFYVANWQEASEIEAILPTDVLVSVLNGVREEDMTYAVQSRAKPVLNSIEQFQRWQQTGRVCDIMVNSGMNRLGINLDELKKIDVSTLQVDIVMSHLASADEDTKQNAEQLAQYQAALTMITGRRKSLCNSAGIALGADYHFDCTRPGLSLYGGIPRPVLAGKIKQVVFPETQILQCRSLQTGDKLGYNAKYVADRQHDIAILAMGYADGYLRGFSNRGYFLYQGHKLPVLGRVSMDLIAVDISQASSLREGDWLSAEYELPIAAQQSGLSQYELITGLGHRYTRNWS